MVAARPRSRGSRRSGLLEEELLPGGPPVVGAGDDRAVVDALDAVAEAEPVRRRRVLVLDRDLAGPTRVVRRDRAQIAQRLLGALLDQRPGAHGRDLAGAVGGEPVLDGDGGQAAAQKRRAFAAGGLVAGDEQHRAAPSAAERGVDPRLADE